MCDKGVLERLSAVVWCCVACEGPLGLSCLYLLFAVVLCCVVLRCVVWCCMCDKGAVERFNVFVCAVVCCCVVLCGVVLM